MSNPFDVSCSVSDLNEYIKRILENDENLHYVYVRGEVSNLKVAMNGHLYFSLKDNKSAISAVMFKDYFEKIKFKVKDGDEVSVLASVSCYTPRGTYSLRVYTMEEKGRGQLLVELEALKRKLQAEGLFDASRKKEIKKFPKAIGLISAEGSAALKDLTTNIERRYPCCDIYIFPAKVQGDDAAKSLIKAIRSTKEYDLDTIIIGRGGGSSEDLSAFNDEMLVREIALCEVPVISAVGHEIDMTLVDYVADKRASTPTGAAEFATPDKRELQEFLSDSLFRMENSIKDTLNDQRDELNELKDALNDLLEEKLNELKHQTELLDEKLTSLDPKRVLNRGFSITSTSDGKVLKSVKDAPKGTEIITILSDGKITSEVK